jgi:putative DNA primase/helicase
LFGGAAKPPLFFTLHSIVSGRHVTDLPIVALTIAALTIWASVKRGRGDYICGQCGAGDGFKLLERVFGWPFNKARRRVMEAAGLADHPIGSPPAAVVPTRAKSNEVIVGPSDRVRRLRRERCAIGNCDDAVDYLMSRHLWPLPNGCVLSAHATVEYWDEGQRVGRYPALITDVCDVAGELVTVHVTYLHQGRKLSTHEPRKIVSPMTGREGCAVRLMPYGDVLGISEGIETAISAAIIDGVPVWAALNTSLLAKFEPPPGVLRLRVYADRDEAGLTAATRLMERLQGRVRLEVRIPAAPAKDWNDVLATRIPVSQLA